MNTTTRRIGSTALALLMIGGLAGTAPAAAKDGDGRVIVRGDCSRRADWKLKAKPDDGRMEVEFEVDSNRNRQVWTWTLRSNGRVFASGKRTTRAPSGSSRTTCSPGSSPAMNGVSSIAASPSGSPPSTCS